MKATLIVEGKEFPIEIHDPELQKLLKPQKKTGYEKANKCETYYTISCDDCITDGIESNGNVNRELYDCANYYSDKTIAENNARADKLMRQLRRFAVEHRNDQLYWAREYCNAKWSIIYDYKNKRLRSDKNWDLRVAFTIYFDSEEAAQLAIDTFHDELIWYFTEYKDSL